MAWLFVHLMSLVSFRNRLLVLIGWAWNYVFYDRPVRLIVSPTPPPEIGGGRPPPPQWGAMDNLYGAQSDPTGGQQPDLPGGQQPDLYGGEQQVSWLAVPAHARVIA